MLVYCPAPRSTKLLNRYWKRNAAFDHETKTIHYPQVTSIQPMAFNLPDHGGHGSNPVAPCDSKAIAAVDLAVFKRSDRR